MNGLGGFFPTPLPDGVSGPHYFVADAISTLKGPFDPTPRDRAASSAVQAFPAFCSTIARGIGKAFSTDWKGYLARFAPTPFVDMPLRFLAIIPPTLLFSHAATTLYGLRSHGPCAADPLPNALWPSSPDPPIPGSRGLGPSLFQIAVSEPRSSMQRTPEHVKHQ